MSKEDDKLHIVSFSGGKDSTDLIFKMLENGMRVDRIINVDTTKEFPVMYDHIERVDTILRKKYKKHIDIITLDFDEWFYNYERPEGKGCGWPTSKIRWCTGLKQAAIMDYIKKELHLTDESMTQKQLSAELRNVVEYVGIAADEKNRLSRAWSTAKPTTVRFPLAELKITEANALQNCFDMGFDWGGLYKYFPRVSCYCCPLQGIPALRNVFLYFPELWAKMQEMDKSSLYAFRPDFTLEQLTRRFELTRPKRFRKIKKMF